MLAAAGLSGTDRYLALIGFEALSLILLFSLALRRAIYRPSVLPEQKMPKALWFVMLSPLLFALIQLAPIPAALWAGMPGHAIYADTLKAVGVSPDSWRALSVSPDATRASLLATIPLAALFLSGFLGTIQQLRVLVRVVAATAFAQIALGLLQISGGEHSPFFFGITTSYGAPIGTMGNRNLYANFLAMALAAYLWLAYDAVRYTMRLQPGAPMRSGTFDNRHAIGAWIGGGLVLVLGILMSRSRGATLFGLSAAFLGLSMAGLRVFGWARGWRFALPVALLLVVTSGWLVGFDNVASRVTAEQLSSSAGFRAELARTSLEGAWAFFPWGSGWGTYAMAYPRFQPDRIAGYANHAHMDYIEMLFEGGLPFLVVGGCVAWLFVRRAVLLLLSAWNKRTLSREAMTAALCGMGLLGFMLHALVDFNMRIFPNALVACLLAGAYLRPLPAEEPEENP